LGKEGRKRLTGEGKGKRVKENEGGKGGKYVSAEGIHSERLGASAHF
jgi:hypothetical protein